MKKAIFTFLFFVVLFLPLITYSATNAASRSGFILLQVEKNGEAWYVYPTNGGRFYLGRPADAFAIMKKLALGVKHDIIANTDVFPARLSGLILLDTEKDGEAFYIYPKDNKKYYLGRPADAFAVMRELGQGISNAGLTSIPVGDIKNINPIAQDKYILQDVPFTSQAPFFGWSDLRQEDGCEEASALMAVSWARGQTLTKDEALKQILGSSDYTLKKYGEYRDISVADTVEWVIKDYFNYQNADAKYGVTLKDIISELEKGNVVIAPMNGQGLGNPNYTQPGPKHHMLVIIGYDPARKIFITNDPGTRKGQSYEYDAQIFYDAIRAYATGFQVADEGMPKDVIVVWK